MLLNILLKSLFSGVNEVFGGFCLYVGRSTQNRGFLEKNVQVGNAYFAYLGSG